MIHLSNRPCNTERCACVRIGLYSLSTLIGGAAAVVGAKLYIVDGSPFGAVMFFSGYAAGVCSIKAMFEVLELG